MMVLLVNLLVLAVSTCAVNCPEIFFFSKITFNVWLATLNSFLLIYTCYAVFYNRQFELTFTCGVSAAPLLR